MKPEVKRKLFSNLSKEVIPNLVKEKNSANTKKATEMPINTTFLVFCKEVSLQGAPIKKFKI